MPGTEDCNQRPARRVTRRLCRAVHRNRSTAVAEDTGPVLEPRASRHLPKAARPLPVEGLSAATAAATAASAAMAAATAGVTARARVVNYLAESKAGPTSSIRRAGLLIISPSIPTRLSVNLSRTLD